MSRTACVLCAVAAVVFPCSFSPAADVAADIDFLFVPRDEFGKHVPQYVPGNIGFFCLHWNGTGACTRATVLVASDATQAERVHAIREELTQAMGLMEDSWTYPDSMFYQGWTPGVQFAEIDKSIIRMLYRTEVRPGMTQAQARQVFRGQYTQAQIDYFCEIAFGSEYASADEPLHKWTRSPTIRVSGQLNATDIRTLNRVIQDLNALMDRVQLKVVQWSVTTPKA